MEYVFDVLTGTVLDEDMNEIDQFDTLEEAQAFYPMIGYID